MATSAHQRWSLLSRPNQPVALRTKMQKINHLAIGEQTGTVADFIYTLKELHPFSVVGYGPFFSLFLAATGNDG